uniref:Uncharacterized protein n=1 Tax=Panagrolaimus davidi TaxID=227884 RepID=A0A914QZH7_9BILA
MMPSNAKSYKKLVKSCKYFFSKNSIYVADDLKLHPNTLVQLSTGFCPSFYITNETVKLWITNTVESYRCSLSPFFPKLYKTDFKKLDLSFQTISYNDFVFISSNVEDITFCEVIVKNEDATIVPLEKLVKALPKIKDISFIESRMSSCITLNTVKELLIIPHFSKINKINFREIPEIFDIETFFAFIKKNKQIKSHLDFSRSISIAYKIRLEAIIDEILQTENHDYKVPFIDFWGCDPEKWRKYRLLVNND